MKHEIWRLLMRWVPLAAAGIALLISVRPGVAQEKAAVRCVLVLPPGEQPWPDALQRLDLVLKDVQWWYSCQMEAHGYGAKTFSLETDEQGKVVVHQASLREIPVSKPNAVPSAVIQAAEKVLGTPPQRRGTVMVIVYNGYYWADQQKLTVLPTGRGLSGRWAHFTGWHLFSVNPRGWSNLTRVSDLPDKNPFFPPLHTQVLKAEKKRRGAPLPSAPQAGTGCLFTRWAMPSVCTTLAKTIRKFLAM